MRITADNVQDAIRSLGQHWRYFHLGPCARCGCPSWQQPCPVCGFYPYGARGYAEGRKWREANPPSFERFEAWHNRHGNIFEAVMAQVSKLVPAGQAMVAPQVDRARREAEGWEWPTARELWDAFGSGSTKESRPDSTHIRISETEVSCPIHGCRAFGPDGAGQKCGQWYPADPRRGYAGGWGSVTNGCHREREVKAYDARRHEFLPRT